MRNTRKSTPVGVFVKMGYPGLGRDINTEERGCETLPARVHAIPYLSPNINLVATHYINR